MKDYSALSAIEASFSPVLFESDGQFLYEGLNSWKNLGMTVRVVRGRKARTLEGMLDEFAAALQFPLYFGENQDAFDECLEDLETLQPGAGYVIVMTEPDQLLADAGDDVFLWFAQSCVRAFEIWKKPISLGEWWDRPAIPFHLVLAGDRQEICRARTRWSDIGFAVRTL